jgi:hypothetical protein
MSSAFDAYMGPGDVPKFQQSCVLYWDILGVRSLSRDPDALSLLVALDAALKQARAQDGFEDPAAQHLHAVTWFTDNVVIGTPVTSYGWSDYGQIEDALGYTAAGAAEMQLVLLEAGFLGRGGIAFGEHHMQPQLAFGPALIDAVELEEHKDEGRPPRVELTPNAAELNREVMRKFYSDPNESPQANLFLVDQQGDVVFVNHLGAWLDEEEDADLAADRLIQQRNIIQDALRRKTGNVLNKWKWLADMHNHVLSQLPGFHDLRIDAGDPQHSFRSFISTL